MGKYDKLLIKILRGTSDKNIDFEELRNLLLKFGFEERVKGSHHILTKDGIEEILNIQAKSGKAKPYQVKQIRNVIVKNQLKLDGGEN
ncbi:type II toxin-antitoxin system HicA family toxin [Cyclobacterium plantarum]|uniref:Type II toxin-antitoxin system HicA family toxin n=1 Tax=Cyclobacterium plantarum TaxID=2716263 RepID=A0ABX0H1W5_9BACT|nr:type II toxin-antitoxin system HicA family toxin [Cyclobacterium plantarum]NHE55783.1 type II toxin-antitoxin system HicA family toxin [Cyclobacterium plantarum]